MNLSVIIVSYNTKDLLKRCLKSIYSGYTMDTHGYKVEIIVVDNGSTDGSLQSINSLEWPNLKIIANKENLGFAKAVNQGIRQAEGKYILLLNSDIIVKPRSIGIMLDFVKKNPQVGVIGGKLLNPDGSVQGSCFFLDFNSQVFLIFSGIGGPANHGENIAGFRFYGYKCSV